LFDHQNAQNKFDKMSDQLKQKKLQEAKQHISDAEKSLKTSLFKRKPDYDSAASAYSLAGTCYKVAKDLSCQVRTPFRKNQISSLINKFIKHLKQTIRAGFIFGE